MGEILHLDAHHDPDHKILLHDGFVVERVVQAPDWHLAGTSGLIHTSDGHITASLEVCADGDFSTDSWRSDYRYVPNQMRA